MFYFLVSNIYISLFYCIYEFVRQKTFIIGIIGQHGDFQPYKNGVVCVYIIKVKAKIYKMCFVLERDYKPKLLK